MSSRQEQELQLGYADFSDRLAHAKLQVLKRDRPWRDGRKATYFDIGKGDRRTDIVISDEYICDLPNTKKHQSAVDAYASCIGKRVSCGPPERFYCQSDETVQIEIQWPGDTVFIGTGLKTSICADAIHLTDDTVALCELIENRFPFPGEEATPFDRVRSIINRVRVGIDQKKITFYKREAHPDLLQTVEAKAPETTSSSAPSAIEYFLAGKVYWLAFKVATTPGYTWIADPWDAAYLGVKPQELSQAAYVLRARGLIELDSSLEFGRPSDKLLTIGWPAALDSMTSSTEAQKFTISALPKKDDLVTDVASALERQSKFALLVIDLDQFKQVNDKKGHPEGDACLERVVKVFGGVVGVKGKLYRWGGDEFAVLLPNFSTAEAHATAERIRREVEQAKPGGDTSVTTSIGVCGSEDLDQPSADVLLKNADKAMYVSKETGKNRVTDWSSQRGEP